MSEEQPHLVTTKPELIPLSESTRIGRELIEKYKQELARILVPDAQIEGVSSEEKRNLDFGKSNIEAALKDIPKETLSRFTGHGIARGSEEGLFALINILQNSTIKGSLANLGEGRTAWTNGDFFVISRVDDRLATSKNNEVGVVVSPGAFVVGTRFYPIVDDLKRLFPIANIIRSNEFRNYIEQQIQTHPNS